MTRRGCIHPGQAGDALAFLDGRLQTALEVLRNLLHQELLDGGVQDSHLFRFIVVTT